MQPQWPNQLPYTPPGVPPAGVPVVAPPAAPLPPPISQPPAGTRFPAGTLLKLLALLAVLAVVYAAGIYTNVGVSRIAKANATKTARGLIGALNQGDTTLAYAYTSDTLRGKQSVSQFSSALGDLKAGQPKLLKSSITFNDRIATYTELEDGLPTDGGGHSTATWTIGLVKSGLFDWRVDGIKVE